MERADPPWELPEYVGEFARSLEETQVWIANGGVAAPVVVAPLLNLLPTDPTLPTPVTVNLSWCIGQRAPDPKRLLSKVRRSMRSSMCWTRALGLRLRLHHRMEDFCQRESGRFPSNRLFGADRCLSRAS